jgi:hypothetical protein
VGVTLKNFVSEYFEYRQLRFHFVGFTIVLKFGVGSNTEKRCLSRYEPPKIPSKQQKQKKNYNFTNLHPIFKIPNPADSWQPAAYFCSYAISVYRAWLCHFHTFLALIGHLHPILDLFGSFCLKTDAWMKGPLTQSFTRF